MPVLESPDGALAARVDDGDDGPTLAVSRDGRTVLEPSPLGVNGHASYLTGAYDLTDERRGTVDEAFRTAAGKRREHRHRAAEATFTYADGDRVVRLDVRAADEGIAYRYRVPLAANPGSDTTMVGGEASAFRLPADALVYAHPFNRNHESTGRGLPAAEAAGAFSTPALARTGDDWALLGEAGVDGRYAAARFAADEGVPTLRFEHPPTTVWARDELVTPWRVAVVGDLGTVVESDLVPALSGAPTVDPRADWIAPGRVAWSWWSDSTSPSDPERQRAFVDYAAERGWEYALVDEGWSPDWAPDLVEYAAERGVGLFLWCHWTELHDAAERAERLDRWADWGVAGVKVDFMDHDDQGRLQFYDALAAAAADRELLVNFHGSVVPTGLRRRFPNVLTFEGAMGAEYYKARTVAPAHNAILPYTRNAVGPMDYTPVAFENPSRHTTPGHELALAVVFESGLQHFADSPESYAARPAAEAFLEAVPAAWDGTTFLRGEPGVEATVARRRGDEWFVGCVRAAPAATVPLEPAFLDAPREGVLVRDDPDGEGLVREARTFDPDDPLALAVPRNGGFAARLSD